MVVVIATLGPGASSVQAQAQPPPTVGRIMGSIVDQLSGEPLRSASIDVLDTDIRGPAGDDGRFILPPMPP